MSSELFFTQSKLRKLYLNFFESKGHLKLESFSLIPDHRDKSLLLINAGMAPLKKYFSGQEKPPSFRVTTCQKCVRKNDSVKPMDPEEAVMELELIGHSFYVFLNSLTNEVNVVYKQKNGSYGLIEPKI